MRPASLVRRGLCHLQRRRNQQGAGPPEQPKSVREFDEERYGGWKSAQMLFADEPAGRQSLIGRADWHAVQFLLALVPPGLILLLVQWARNDMKKMEARLEVQALAKESQKLAAVTKHQQAQAEKAAADGGTGEAAAGSSTGGEATGSSAGEAAAGSGEPAAAAAAAGGSKDVEQRLTRLEVLIRQLQAQQQPEQEQEQQASGNRPEGSARGQQPQQEQEPQQPQVQQQQRQQGTPSLAGRVTSAARWLGSRMVGHPRQEPSNVQASAPADRAPDSSSGSAESTMTAAGSHSRSAAEQAADAAVPSAPAVVRAPAAPSAAADTKAAEPSVAAAPEAAAAAQQPGNMANRLLHAIGQPLRRLRQGKAGDPEQQAMDRMLHSWMHKADPDDAD